MRRCSMSGYGLKGWEVGSIELPEGSGQLFQNETLADDFFSRMPAIKQLFELVQWEIEMPPERFQVQTYIENNSW